MTPQSLIVGLLLVCASVNAETIDFSLANIENGNTQLSDYRGQWVVANYWATWCSPCRKEIPELSNLHDEREDVVVLGLAFEDAEPQTFIDFLQKYPASYPILLTDTFSPPAALGAPIALPTTFLINPEGELVDTLVGPVKREEIEAVIATHL